jgi:glucose-6-phosphate isomerase
MTVLSELMMCYSTAIPKVEAFGIAGENAFGFWDWVGGRYSVCSAVGALPLSLIFGPQVVQQFLQGAHDMDSHFFEAPIRDNLPVLLGLLGVWNSSFLGHPAKAILPCEFNRVCCICSDKHLHWF